MFHHLIRAVIWIPVLISTLSAQGLQPKLLETRKIWDRAPHNAFTDLVRWHDRFYCAFREGQGHAGDLGSLRIIVSDDGQKWVSAGLLSLEHFDLRDAALSVTPDDRLMVIGGAQQTSDGKRRTGTFVSFSKDGQQFDQPNIVISPGRWLWRVTWHGNTAYGVSYGTPDDPEYSALLKTADGLQYLTVTDKLAGPEGWPTEARIRFAANGTAYCLHRRDGTPATALLGTAQPPYQKWTWQDLGVKLGGPNLLQLPNGQWVAVGRLYDGGARTELVAIDVEQGTLTPLLRLPSGGDTSYPGLVWHEGQLWISYYASHEGKTSIYLSRVRFPGQTASATDNATDRAP